MRHIGRVSAVFGVVFIVTLIVALTTTRPSAERADGQQIFRFDTFGDEQLWTNVLRMHEVVAGVDPATALAVGLKVDADALPQSVRDALRAGQVDLTDPSVTTTLLKLNAVVGLKGSIDDSGQLTSLGITCAL